MRTYIKAAIMCLVAVFLAYAATTLTLSYLGKNEESNALDDYSDMMLLAREYFLEYSDDFQSLTAGIMDSGELHIVRASDGAAALEIDGQWLSAEDGFAALGLENAQELAEMAQTLFAGAELTVDGTSGSELVSDETAVQSIYVSEGEVFFFTAFHSRGCVGICYTPSGEAGGFMTIELVEDWQIFYDILE